MKKAEAAHTRPGGEFPGLSGGEMTLAGCDLSVDLQKISGDEQMVCTTGQLHGPCRELGGSDLDLRGSDPWIPGSRAPPAPCRRDS